MTHAGRRTIAVLIVSLGLLLLATMAVASSRRRHAFRSTVRVVQFSVHGASIIHVGFEDSTLGHAVVSSVDKLGRRIKGTTYRLIEVSRHYYPDGSYTARAIGTTTLNSDGTTTTPPLVEKIVSGTGRFRDAAGKWTAHGGFVVRFGQPITLHLKGFIIY
jgi:hypothetical protein